MLYKILSIIEDLPAKESLESTANSNYTIGKGRVAFDFAAIAPDWFLGNCDGMCEYL
jgi:hypothetical protein